MNFKGRQGKPAKETELISQKRPVIQVVRYTAIPILKPEEKFDV
ncbi:hypothetical protein [Halarsenatibacter silvermanii]|nr:hypothetical protein [Halarsenatibacter silvermanii]